MDVFTYQNVDMLAALFNAVAMVTGSGGFRSSIAVLTMIGFIAAFLAYALAPQKMAGWQWLAMVTLVFAVLVVPKTRVVITDITAYQAPQVVDNVPFGLALVTSVSTGVGSMLTELFETAFSAVPAVGLPPDLRFGRNGLLFGNQLIDLWTNAVFTDQVFRTDVTHYVSNCVMPELASGRMDADAFSNATDVWPMMADTNPARFSTLMTSGGVTVAPCDQVYANLNQRVAAQLETMRGRIASVLHPGITPAQALTQLDQEFSAVDAKYQLAAAATGASNALLQAGMLNAVTDSTSIECARSADAACVVLSQGRAAATAQANQAWRGGALMARQGLPMFRNIVEALCIGIFPLVLLLLLLGAGADGLKGMRNYALIFVWIQLWAPLCGVLNYMATIYAGFDCAAAATLATVAASKGMALVTVQQINASVLSTQAAVGYLMLSVPVIAWQLVRGLESAGSALAGGLTDLARGAQTAAAEGSKGNFNYGSVSMNQQALAAYRSSPSFSTAQNDADGAAETRHADGTLMQRQAMLSKAGVEVTRTFTMGSKQSQAASSAVSKATQELSGKSNRYLQLVSDQVGHSAATNQTQTATDASSVGTAGNVANNLQKLVAVAGKISKASGVTMSEALRGALGVTLAGTGINMTGDMQSSKAYGAAKEIMTKQDIANAQSYIASANKQTTGASSDGTSTSQETGHSSSLQRAYDEVRSASVVLGQAEETRNHVEQHQGETFTVSASPTALSPALGVLLDPAARAGRMDSSDALRNAADAAHLAMPTALPLLRPPEGHSDRPPHSLTPHLDKTIVPTAPTNSGDAGGAGRPEPASKAGQPDEQLQGNGRPRVGSHGAKNEGATPHASTASRAPASQGAHDAIPSTAAGRVASKVEAVKEEAAKLLDGIHSDIGSDKEKMTDKATRDIEKWRQQRDHLQEKSPTGLLQKFGSYLKGTAEKIWPGGDDDAKK